MERVGTATRHARTNIILASLQGIPLRDVSFPVHPTSQATVLTWHPERKILLTGWENGEIHAWFEGKRDLQIAGISDKI